jgi:hypothetical protein
MLESIEKDKEEQLIEKYQKKNEELDYNQINNLEKKLNNEETENSISKKLQISDDFIFKMAKDLKDTTSWTFSKEKNKFKVYYKMTPYHKKLYAFKGFYFYSYLSYWFYER